MSTTELAAPADNTTTTYTFTLFHLNGKLPILDGTGTLTVTTTGVPLAVNCTLSVESRKNPLPSTSFPGVQIGTAQASFLAASSGVTLELSITSCSGDPSSATVMGSLSFTANGKSYTGYAANIPLSH